MTVTCPCCGSEVPEVKLDGLSYVQLGPSSGALLRALVEAYPRALSTDQLVFGIWRGHNYEPEYASNTVHVLLGRLRRKLKAHGWAITALGRGKQNSATPAYRLAQIGKTR